MRMMLITLCILGTLLTATPTKADERPLQTISVSGQGKVAAPPDMATVHTGVVTEAATSRQALAANNEAMEKIMAVIKTHHVASKDVQTSSFTVSPVYRRNRQGGGRSEIVGYRVQNQLRVHVRNLPNLGEVLDALVQAGSNQVSGISFGVEDPISLLNQVRSGAIGDARSRAAVYAQAAGVRLGPVRSISEVPVQIPRTRQFAAFTERPAASVPVATGEMEFAVTVYVVFDLEDLDAAKGKR